jgi:hypothetical protein
MKLTERYPEVIGEIRKQREIDYLYHDATLEGSNITKGVVKKVKSGMGIPRQFQSKVRDTQ